MKESFDNEFAKEVANLPKRKQNIINQFAKGDTLTSIAANLKDAKITKQRVSVILHETISNIYTNNQDIKNIVDETFLSEQELYIDCTVQSVRFAKIFAKMAKIVRKDLYNVKHTFITSEKLLVWNTAPALWEIREKGLPLKITKPNRLGQTDRISFVYLLNKKQMEKEYIILGSEIYAYKKLKFIPNSCFWLQQTKRSIAEIYQIFYFKSEETKKFLIDENIETPKKLYADIQLNLHNYKKNKQELCHFELKVSQVESPFDFSVYDYVSVDITEQKVLETIRTTLRRIGVNK